MALRNSLSYLMIQFDKNKKTIFYQKYSRRYADGNLECHVMYCMHTLKMKFTASNLHFSPPSFFPHTSFRVIKISISGAARLFFKKLQDFLVS